MIFYWLVKAWRLLLWLLRPPTARDVARIDPNAKCPVCGATSGKICCVLQVKTVSVSEAGAPSATNTTQAVGILANHECAVCGARWLEKPILEVGTQLVLPAKGSEFVRAA